MKISLMQNHNVRKTYAPIVRGKNIPGRIIPVWKDLLYHQMLLLTYHSISDVKISTYLEFPLHNTNSYIGVHVCYGNTGLRPRSLCFWLTPIFQQVNWSKLKWNRFQSYDIILFNLRILSVFG